MVGGKGCVMLDNNDKIEFEDIAIAIAVFVLICIGGFMIYIGLLERGVSC
jgi:hypothetical protein